MTFFLFNLNNDAFGGTVIQAPGLAGIESALKTQQTDAKTNKPQKSLLRQMFGGSNDEPGLTTVLMAAFNISQDRLARSRLAGDPADISINPRANGIGMFDFDLAAEAIEAGREAAARVIPDIKQSMETLEAASK